MGCSAARHAEPIARAPPQPHSGAVSSAWSPATAGAQAPATGCRSPPPQFGPPPVDDKADTVSCATTAAPPGGGKALEPLALCMPPPVASAAAAPAPTPGAGAAAPDARGGPAVEASPSPGVVPSSPASPNSGPSPTSLSAGLPSGGLSLPSPEERMQAYQKYRMKRQSHKEKGRGAAKKLFLSNVPEVEADIPFRFSFMVMGPAAVPIIQAVCDSPAAQAMQQMRAPSALATLLSVPASSSEGDGMGMEPSNSAGVGAALSTGSLPPFPGSGRMSRTSSNGGSMRGAASSAVASTFRCLCPVGPAPRQHSSAASASGQSEEPKDDAEPRLAKLQFQALDLTEEVPAIYSRSEALSSVVVFALWVDDLADMPGGAGGDEASFEECLLAVDKAVRRTRARTKAKLRPVRALLLCQRPATGAPPSDRWAVALSDFENKNGYIWRFGPVRPDLGNSVYAAFAEMAASRATARDVMGEHGEDEAEDGEEDGEEVTAAGTEENLEQTFASQSLVVSSYASECSYNSETSEGWQLPPRFDTERSGTDVSEGAMEMHAKCMKEGGGLSRQVSTGSTYSVYSQPVPHWGSERSGSEVADYTLEMHQRAFGPLGAMQMSSEAASMAYGTEQTDSPAYPTDSLAYPTDASADSGASTEPSRHGGSTGSAGLLSPIGFRTEQSGSSVSTSALELHNAAFSFPSGGSLPQLRSPPISEEPSPTPARHSGQLRSGAESE